MEFIPKYTSFGVVDKRVQQKLSHTEFNEYINQLADQGNHNARAIVELNGEMIAFEILLNELGGTNLEVIQARQDNVNQILYATIGARLDSLREDIRSVGIRFEEGFTQVMGSFDEKLGDYITKAEYSSSIQQSATQILLEVDKKIEVNAQNYYTKEEHQSQIKQQAAEILLQVDEKIETVNNFNPNNYYTKTETTSQIKQQAGEIALTVSKKEVSNLQIGGTNLLLNSDERKQLDRADGVAFNEISYAIIDTYRDSVLTQDTSFVLSFMADRFSNTEFECFDTITFDVGWNQRWTRDDIEQIIYIKNNTHKFIMKPKVLPRGVTVSSKLTFIAEHDYGGGVFYNVMLSEGNKVLDWTYSNEELPTVSEMNSAIVQKANEITHMVSETYTTKDDIRNNYSTKSELIQTANDFTFKLQNSGGYNVVRNGNALNGQAHWAAYWLPSASWGVRHDDWTGAVPCFQINNETGAAQENAIYQVVPTTTGKTYTVSARVAGHRGMNGLVIVNGAGTHEVCRTNTAYDRYGGMDAKDWEICTATFVAPESSVQIRLWSQPIQGSVNSYGWFKEIQIEEGAQRTNYSPNPEEVYTGVTRIDNGGVRVTHSGDDSYSHMGWDGFNFYSHGSGHRYHNLMKQGWVDTLDFNNFGANGWAATITLPPEFRGKPFSVIPCISYIGCPHIADAVKSFEVNVPHDQVDYNNGTFRIYIYAGGLWAEGLQVTYSVQVRATWIAIA